MYKKFKNKMSETKNNVSDVKMKFFFKKWQFYSTVCKIRQKNGYIDDELMSRLIDSQTQHKCAAEDEPLEKYVTVQRQVAELEKHNIERDQKLVIYEKREFELNKQIQMQQDEI